LLVGPTPVFLVAALTASVVLYVWGSLAQIPHWHDEASYLLQAGLFARGHWSAPPPPAPEFFQQLYVLFSPVLASKYPPGHALLLTPGVLLGLPGLVPVVLSALTGALVFVLGRRLAGPVAGLLGWIIWLGTLENLQFRASYLSEVTTSALWVIGWYALLRWHRDRRHAWLVLLAATVGWQAITRPLTAVAFAVPALVVVIATVARERRWRELVLPVVVGSAILAIVPVWSYETTGDWRTTPLTLYTNRYTPWDKPGFGAATDSPPPMRAPDITAMDEIFRSHHAAHTVAGLPHALFARTKSIGASMWGSWRMVLLPFAALGLVGLSAVELTGLATAVCLVLAYLAYAHPPIWTLYYLELHPALALLTALGMVRAGRQIPERWQPGAAALAAIPLVILTVVRADEMRRQIVGMFWEQHAFQQLLDMVPDSRTIVFVRYRPNHVAHKSLIRNEPFLADADHWIVYDRGAENARLLRLAPDRAPYLYDEATSTITKLPMTSPAAAP
jgi:Dolichyl-phosphate-mannose-protein mannosyltransferase